jgi:NADH dehydrogenase
LSEQTKDAVPYFAAKWEMERAVKESGIDYVIFRSSFVFGKDGGALPTFIRLARLAPVTPVVGSGTLRLQPIWVEDVAEYFARSLDMSQAANRIFELGGPDTVDWNGLYRTIAKVLGKRRRLVHIPFPVAQTGAALTQRLPGAPLSADQVRMLQLGDIVVANSDAVDTFQLPLVALEEQIRRVA